MTHSIGDEELHGQTSEGDSSGPDPVFGAAITLLGIFLMGTGGARDAHYVFDVGVAVAVLGAATFVVCVALSAMKQRRAIKDGATSRAPTELVHDAAASAGAAPAEPHQPEA